MRVEPFDGDDPDIGWMIRDAASTCIGPSPRAGQSRWGAASRPRWQVGRAVRLSAAAMAFTAVIFVSVVFAAVAVTPGAPATSVTKLTNGMLHVFAGGAVASPTQAPAVPASAQSPSSAAPRPGTAPVTGPSPARRGPTPLPTSRPTPEPSESPDD